MEAERQQMAAQIQAHRKELEFAQQQAEMRLRIRELEQKVDKSTAAFSRPADSTSDRAVSLPLAVLEAAPKSKDTEAHGEPVPESDSQRSDAVTDAPPSEAGAASTPADVDHQAAEMAARLGSPSTAPQRESRRESKAKANQQQRRESVSVSMPLPDDDTESHFFISHCQSSGGDQANTLCLELERMGFVVGDPSGRDDLTRLP